MGERGVMPPLLRAMPATMRNTIKKQCGGDWRRVTVDKTGGVMVHNLPQRELEADEEALHLRKRLVGDPTRAVKPRAAEPAPEPERPARPPLWDVNAPCDVRHAPDTSTFRRTELPPVLATKKRTPRPRPKPNTTTNPIDLLIPAPSPHAAPPNRPVPDAAMFKGPPSRHVRPPLNKRRPVTPTDELGRPDPKVAARNGVEVEQLRKDQDPDAKIKRRSGAPRSASEGLKRLLDMGCKYVRMPSGQYAQVFYNGTLIGTVRSDDPCPTETVVDDYRRIRRIVEAIQAPPQRAG